MDIQHDPVQPFIALPLPILPGSVDFVKYEKLLMRIGDILDASDVEHQFVELAVAKIEKETKEKLSPKNRDRAMRYAALSLRCNIARVLAKKGFREMAVQLADSYLLRRFCRLDGLLIPAKNDRRFQVRMTDLKTVVQTSFLSNLKNFIIGQTHTTLWNSFSAFRMVRLA